jgi:hypothetical protein
MTFTPCSWQINAAPLGHTALETRVFMTDGIQDGVRYSRGQRMLTWQVIRDASLFSYDALMNPEYKAAVTAIQYAVKRVRWPLVGAHVSAALLCST